ncbi:hypothetical protein F5J12DRAFT_951999 [Pisolithus orientalis]|uniref:uncharacterized protein n=1 Tax=Pisolithus orientalis TaxID=936130 RepID=UPI00222591B2|nr:uncharacterized protein F5J12DRAFT_951999 [Pisolithus orientalis]KAI5999851.1 hypothetical protein F5J12DRAFT_951999 [Pisolithus orientalis]
MRSMHLLGSILFLSLPIGMAKASLSVGTATECGPLAVSWTGGQNFLWIFIFSVNYSSTWYPVPSSAYSGNKGNYTIPQLPLSQGQQFVLSVYDEAGFITGSTSDLLQVEGPTDGSSCNTTSSQTFSFALALQPCGPYIFNDYQGAVLPVSIMAIVPGGESIILSSNVTTTSYNWTADVQAGASIIFSMLDADSNSGGCSLLQAVDDTSCLDFVGTTNFNVSEAELASGETFDGVSFASVLPSPLTLPLTTSASTGRTGSSPTSTSQTGSSPASTSRTGSSPTSTSQTGSNPMSTTHTGSGSPTTLSSAAIAGVVGGVVVILFVLVIYCLCLRRRKRKDSSTYPTPTTLDVHPAQMGNLHHGPDTPVAAYAYHVLYQSDHDQPFVSPGRTMQSIIHPYAQETYTFHRASATLQQDPFADTTNCDFAVDNDTDIPLGPPSAGSAVRHILGRARAHSKTTLSTATSRQGQTLPISRSPLIKFPATCNLTPMIVVMIHVLLVYRLSFWIPQLCLHSDNESSFGSSSSNTPIHALIVGFFDRYLLKKL